MRYLKILSDSKTNGKNFVEKYKEVKTVSNATQKYLSLVEFPSSPFGYILIVWANIF